MVDIIAHRGSSSYTPENTKAAFNKAVQDKVDGVELDVHLTKDKKAVVIHDERIDRTSNGKGFVKDYTFQQLKEFDFGSFFSEDYQGEKILSLAEALEIVKELDLINIEIKKGYGINEGIEKAIIKDIKEKELNEKVLISSFNHESLLILQELEENINTAALFFAKVHKPWQYAKMINCKYLHLYYVLVNQALVQACHKNNIKVNVFTVNEEYDIKKMLACDVDGIITDYPLRVRDIIKKSAQR